MLRVSSSTVYSIKFGFIEDAATNLSVSCIFLRVEFLPFLNGHIAEKLSALSIIDFCLPSKLVIIIFRSAEADIIFVPFSLDGEYMNLVVITEKLCSTSNTGSTALSEKVLISHNFTYQPELLNPLCPVTIYFPESSISRDPAKFVPTTVSFATSRLSLMSKILNFKSSLVCKNVLLSEGSHFMSVIIFLSMLVI